MLKLIAAALLFAHLPAAASAAAPAPPPAALAADPAPDAEFPATSGPVQIPTGGVTIDGNLLVAAGAGPHPTLVICNGLPGVEKNLDVAQAARRAGWNVLVFHYRGAWGSRGDFTYANAAADGEAAVAFLRDPAVAARHRIDPARIVLFGHSFGGFIAARAAGRTGALGVILVDAWNAASARARLADPAGRAGMMESWKQTVVPLHGATPETIARDLEADTAGAFELATYLPTVKDRPLLFIGAARGNGPRVPAQLAAAQAAGATQAVAHVWPTNHTFDDHRLKLATSVVEWLGQFGR